MTSPFTAAMHAGLGAPVFSATPTAAALGAAGRRDEMFVMGQQRQKQLTTYILNEKIKMRK